MATKKPTAAEKAAAEAKDAKALAAKEEAEAKEAKEAADAAEQHAKEEAAKEAAAQEADGEDAPAAKPVIMIKPDIRGTPHGKGHPGTLILAGGECEVPANQVSAQLLKGYILKE